MIIHNQPPSSWQVVMSLASFAKAAVKPSPYDRSIAFGILTLSKCPLSKPMAFLKSSNYIHHNLNAWEYRKCHRGRKTMVPEPACTSWMSVSGLSRAPRGAVIPLSFASPSGSFPTDWWSFCFRCCCWWTLGALNLPPSIFQFQSVVALQNRLERSGFGHWVWLICFVKIKHNILSLFSTHSNLQIPIWYLCDIQQIWQLSINVRKSRNTSSIIHHPFHLCVCFSSVPTVNWSDSNYSKSYLNTNHVTKQPGRQLWMP